MKKLPLFIFVYNIYDDYQRYYPENTNYEVSKTIDSNYHDQNLVHNYFKAIENLNSYVTMQWIANRIDVLHPE